MEHWERYIKSVQKVFCIFCLRAWWDTRGASQMGMYEIDRWLDLRASFVELFQAFGSDQTYAGYIDEKSNQKHQALFVY